MSNAELSLIGPVERKPGKGFLASEQIGRWLSFSISLANERGDLHRASGWIVLIINPFTKLPKMEKALNDASIQERLTFFGKFAVGIGEPQGARLGRYRYSEEFVYFNSSESYTASLGFLLEDGSLLKFPNVLTTSGIIPRLTEPEVLFSRF